MTRPELGVRRRCLTCSAAFFDLKKDPIICVKCGAVFNIVELPRSPPRRAAVQMHAPESAIPAITDDDADPEGTSDDAAGEESILALPDEDDENEALEGIVPISGDDDKAADA